ncbi:hypothetical protein ABIE26_005329 [Pedobacter africanus]|uniref:Uncharacterized protein n=1 Tax=Pedobacter africanus TaxID=151894 RepID=A0ACC6L4R6_9SPHI|nr:hypothetical protein [Pedobacter africanus]MDR6786484.1 hypothetical protein [Pedobacter africanus]
MKKRLSTLMILLLSSICYAQTKGTVPNAQTNVTVPVRLRPFLGSKNLTAIGDLKTGTVKVSMDLWNQAWALSWGGLERTNYFKFKLTPQEQEQVNKIDQNSRKSALAADRIGTYCN